MADMQPLVDWFEKQGGELDSSAIGFAEFPAEDGGRGAIAVRDLPVREFA
jgi:SET domain-containing protein 6